MNYNTPPNPYFRYTLVYSHKEFSDFTGESWDITLQLDKDSGEVLLGKDYIENCLKGSNICNFTVNKEKAISIAKEYGYESKDFSLAPANVTGNIGWAWFFGREKHFDDGCVFEMILEINLSSGKVHEEKGGGTCP